MPNLKAIERELTEQDIATLKDQLQKKRREVADLYELDVRAGQESTDDNADDFADRANNSYNRETMFALSDNERHMVLMMDEALKRIDNNAFGYCVHCSNQIGVERLYAIPWARYCIDCQEKHERGLLED
jgi:DnaK suppressor protein